jgi:hypothetical protein
MTNEELLQIIDCAPATSRPTAAVLASRSHRLCQQEANNDCNDYFRIPWHYRQNFDQLLFFCASVISNSNWNSLIRP